FRAHHRRHCHRVIFQLGDQIFNICDNEAVLRVTVADDGEVDGGPPFFHYFHGLLNLHFTLSAA
ncbi:MAG: hypothetical protein ACK559_08170, partial [bacterium]